MLDLRADAYACLPGAGAALSSDRRALVTPAEDVADDLRAAGLVDAREAARPEPQRHYFPAQQSLLAREPGVMRGRDLLEMTHGVSEVLRHYRRKPLHAIVAQARREQLSNSPTMTAEVAAVAGAFQRWAPYAPLSGKCLLRSFLLLRRLRSRGLDALWVFGVRTWPFSAHCWLQCADVVLDDDLDRTRGFAPILVV
ncbi:lasso peptide biosynthesis B2 protein [Phenylobacterium sp. VNQ135]|uniref:lasso peptide biosynthesis B2 protein n=1 Tax=Phenylobacterium sp. VNQ135 TaxID=3400922 RepID=UPI003C2E2AB2